MFRHNYPSKEEWIEELGGIRGRLNYYVQEVETSLGDGKAEFSKPVESGKDVSDGIIIPLGIVTTIAAFSYFLSESYTSDLPERGYEIQVRDVRGEEEPEVFVDNGSKREFLKIDGETAVEGQPIDEYLEGQE